MFRSLAFTKTLNFLNVRSASKPTASPSSDRDVGRFHFDSEIVALFVDTGDALERFVKFKIKLVEALAH